MKITKQVLFVVTCLQAMSLAAFAQDQTEVHVTVSNPQESAPVAATSTAPAGPKEKSDLDRKLDAAKAELSTVKLKELKVGYANELTSGSSLAAGVRLSTDHLELNQDYRIGSSQGTVLPYANVELAVPGGAAPRFPAFLKDQLTNQVHDATTVDKLVFNHDSGMGIGWQFKAARELTVDMGDGITLQGAGEAGVRHSHRWLMMPFIQARGKVLYAKCTDIAGDKENVACIGIGFGAAVGPTQQEITFEANASLEHSFEESNPQIKSIALQAGTSLIAAGTMDDGAKGTGVAGLNVVGKFK